MAQDLMESVQLVRPIFRSRHNASILLENSKVEVVVDFGADYEYGVACRGRQLLKIQETEQEGWFHMLSEGTPGGRRPTVPSTVPE